jgi:hypothetical protein
MNPEYLSHRLKEVKIKRLHSSNKGSNMPSYAQIAKNVGSSLVKNTISVVQGNDLKISSEEAQKRLDICKTCEFFDKNSQRCSKCGCYLSVKTYLKAEHCPIGKW